MSKILLLMPLFGILLLWFDNKNRIQYTGLIITQINLMHTQIMLHLYDPNVSTFQFQQKLGETQIGGIDGISIWLILLVNLIIPIVILNAWKVIGKKDIKKFKKFIIQVLFVNFWSNAVFFVLDLLLFYISFEGVQVPMYFLIGYYGSRNKKIEDAQNKFFIYTQAGSLFQLLSILTIYIETGTTDYQILLTLPIASESFQIWLWLGFFIAFAVKTPMWPVHIWLPVAHGESSTGASVILAAILLKLGTYGFLRYLLPQFPVASQYFLPLVLMLAIISIIYSCITAQSLIDLKQIVAYSSIAHMNVGVIGIFSNDLNGISGAYLYSIAHGCVSGGLFLLVGMIYDRYHSRTLKYYRGLVLFKPIYVVLLLLFSLSNLSFPLSLGFIAEFMIFISTIEISPIITLLVSGVSVLLPIYFIWTFQRISFGSISNYLPTLYQDINIKEFHQLFPLLFLTILFGIKPNLILDSILIPLLTII